MLVARAEKLQAVRGPGLSTLSLHSLKTRSSLLIILACMRIVWYIFLIVRMWWPQVKVARL
jgi:hypothetical protein